MMVSAFWSVLAVCGRGWECLAATYTASRFDSTRFRKDHAELAAAYTKQTTARRFSIN